MADNELTLIISAQDNATKVLVKVSGAVKDVEEKAKATTKAVDPMAKAFAAVKSGIGDSMKSILGFATAAGAVTVVISKMVNFLSDSLTTYIAYADQVRTLTQVTGASAEEMSRLIQVTDDYGVSVEQLTASTRFLAKQGLSPTINTIADLSDQFLKLSSGAEKTQFLLKNFGRSGLAFAEAMQQGGDALRSASEGISQNLILTQQAIEQARDYKFAQDYLNDTLEGFKVIIGVDLAGALVADIALLILAKNATKGFMDATNNSKTATEIFAQAVKDTKTEMEAITNAGRALQGEFGDNTDGTDELTRANQDLLGVMGQLQSASDNYAQSQEGVIDKMDELNQQIELAKKQGYSERGSKIKGLRQDLEDLSEAYGENADAFEDANHRIIIGLLTQKFLTTGEDGLSDTEMAMLVELQKQWGMLSDVTADNSTKISEYAQLVADGKWTVEQFGKAIAALPKETELGIIVHYTVEGGMGLPEPVRVKKRSGLAESEATGGPLGAGWTMVGDAPGGKVTPYTELISPSGYVYNAAQTRGILASGMVTPRAMYAGGINGPISSPDDPLTITPGGNEQIYNQQWYTSQTSSNTSGGKKTTTAVKAITSAAVGAGKAAAASVAASRMTDEALQQQINVSQQQNDMLITEIRALRSDITRAVRDAVQQVVA